MMNKTEEFLKLVQANPHLTIVPMVYYEVCADDSGSWMGSWGEAHVTKIIKGKERIWEISDDGEEVMSDIIGWEQVSNMSLEQVKVMFNKLDWKECIVVYIDLPEEE